MNIIIPIGGIGKRFSDEGFTTPKPLINVLGKPMIHRVISSLSVRKNDILTIIFNPELNFFNFKSSLIKEFPRINFSFIELEGQTRGASETILFGLNKSTDLDLEKEFLILDCDTFYEDDILEKYRKSKNKNNIFYFIDKEDLPIFSYIQINEKGEVQEIKEKIKISQNANTGAYGFRNGKILKSYCEKILENSGELYVSSVYHKMIEEGEIVSSSLIENFSCVGTPLQLRIYSENNRPESQIKFCFDLDNTLVSYPEIEGDYLTVSPIQKNVDYLNFLKSKGNYIIIYTARRMKTHFGNTGKVIKDIGKLTIETLERFGIQYDEIHFGKPHADFYIDDLGINAFDSLDKKTGFFQTQNSPRSFNSVSYLSERVIKKTNNPGEPFWYENCPEEIRGIIPKIYYSDPTTIEMEKIRGINFSYLYVNGALREENLEELLDQIAELHVSKKFSGDREIIYGNYLDKILERYEKNHSLYSSLEESDYIFYSLEDYFKNYQSEEFGKPGVVHGDPVFTNVFQTERGIKLIDPRGKIGDHLTIFGDVYYDYAKIFQSIIGYDHILNDVEINYEYQNRMIDIFEKRFSEDEQEKIKWICSSLIFTLIPLHSYSKTRFNKYINTIKKLIKCN